MMSFLGLLLSVFIGTAAAQPVNPVGPCMQGHACYITGGTQTGADVSGNNVTATGSTTARTHANRAADVINIKDFGAVGDDTADDTAAINAALAYARTNLTAGQKAPALYFPQGVYRTTGPLNFTGFATVGITLYGQGAVIDCQMSGGTACLDALGSRFLRFYGLRIYGNPAFVPKYGVQIGRIAAATPADDHQFFGLRIDGYFATCSLLNFGAETTLFDGLFVQNTKPDASVYGICQDGINHFNVTSTFVTETAPVDSPVSFNENTFLSVNVGIQLGTAVYLASTARHAFIGGYIGSGGATAVLLDQTRAGNGLLNFDVHVETPSIQRVFLITGTANATLEGLRYRDHNTNTSAFVFQADAGVATVVGRYWDMELNYRFGGVSVFDPAATFYVSGDYKSDNLNAWNVPTEWSGCLDVAGRKVCGLYGSAVALAMQAQFADNTTAGGNNRGANAVDWQTTRTNANQVASGTDATIGGGLANRANGNQSTVVGGQGNVSSGQYSISGGLNNQASGAESVAFGASNVADGPASVVTGVNSNAKGRFGAECASSGMFATSGDAQRCNFVLRISTAAAAGVVLTADGSGIPNPTNCANIPDNSAYAITIDVVAIDQTAPANNVSWNGWTALLTRGAGVATTAIVAGPMPAALSNGTGAGTTLALTASVTQGCMVVTWTPPALNTDLWNVVAKVATVEVK